MITFITVWLVAGLLFTFYAKRHGAVVDSKLKWIFGVAYGFLWLPAVAVLFLDETSKK